jgi:lysozyme family protein
MTQRKPRAKSPSKVGQGAAPQKVPKKNYFIEQIANERGAFYRSLSTFNTFGKGWLRRNDETMEQALNMG